MLTLKPVTVTDRYVHGHDIGGPLVAEPVAGNTCAVETLQRADKPDLVLEADGRRVTGEDDWRI